jgi:hypothetical protein
VITAYAPRPQELVDSQITATQIADDAVTTPKLIANAVVAGKIAASAVTADKLSIGSRAKQGLVLNGGFEDGLAGWSPSGAVSIVASASFSGINRLDLAAVGAFDASVTSRTFPLRAGDTIYVGCQAKAVAGTANLTIQINFLDAAGGLVTNTTIISYSSASTTWVAQAGTLIAPAGTFQATVQIYSGNATSTISVDEVEVRTGDMLLNADGNVLIDRNGVVIQNGKMTFKGPFGSTSLDQFGFGPAWSRFVRTGVYNGDFTAGQTTDIPVSEVGGGSGLANYQASMSPFLPYWIVRSSGGTIKQVADAAASSGFALQVSASAVSQVNAIYQDIPVVPGRSYTVAIRSMYLTDPNVTISVTLSWRDANHTIIGSSANVSTGPDAAYLTDYVPTDILTSQRAPDGAAFLRVDLQYTHVVATAKVNISDVELRELFTETATYAGGSAVTLTTSYQPLIQFSLSQGIYLVIFNLYVNHTATGAGDIAADIQKDYDPVGGTGVIAGTFPPMNFPTAVTRIGQVGYGYVEVTGQSTNVGVRAKKGLAGGTIAITVNDYLLIRLA